MIHSMISFLFFLLLYAPFYFYEIKAPLFIIVVLLIWIKISYNKGIIHVSKEIFLLTLFYMGVGLFFLLIGIDQAADESLKYLIPLYVLYPIIYFYLISEINEKLIYTLQRVLVYSIIFISLYNTLYIFMLIGYIPVNELIMSLGVAQNATISTNGVTQIASVSLSTLVFAIPYVLALIFSNRPIKKLHIKKVILYLVIVFGLISVILSGRRALIVTSILSIVTYYLLLLFLPKEERISIFRQQRKLIFKVILIVIPVFLWFIISHDINIGAYIDSFTKFNPESDNIRILQAKSLFNAFSEYPIFGSGHGTYTDVIRSDKPWRYELSYLSLLFHTGIVGVLLYIVGILWIYYKGIIIIKNGGDNAIIMIALLNGLTAMMISYMTNPYLNAFDILWVIFLPVSYINIVYQRNKPIYG